MDISDAQLNESSPFNERAKLQENILEVNNIEVVYNDIVQVLRGVSLHVAKGTIVALLGTNGAGKTTALRAISGLLKPENGAIKEGYIKFLGKDITNKLGTEIVRHGAVMVPEGRRVFKHLTVSENIKVGSITRRDGSEKINDDYQLMYRHFPRLANITNRMAGYSSGGEQQMIAIARALMAAPEMLMLDEPSLGLAPLLVKEIFDNIVQINRVVGTTILVVEQNAKIALEIADYAYIMESGRIVLEGAAEDLKNNPDVKEFYLGVTKGGGRKSFKDIKSYKRRKRWM
ncbi:branched-chain amino acid transport protein (ABC superfamily, ATP_bind) [Desulfamplus magnetovallimortis]|uniref:Branched-chain amino acid transport protein (ABC superfamily, ATP_bind) n=1 Tax=Desulfamplus magnetovallimortis TaxID=1246637 RepID=A0A1W1HDD8_9BACT|nr:ABC transporter ATP-binding protein [Desulfamplus magnetovallimortis]SLM30443.1 branched-chain amino acid transport protein (ABC superfamily, ATP_bind) [Desulfamplus magnetovallimortis]